MMTPAQCRAARALVKMSQARLAALAVVPIKSVRDFELDGKAWQADIDVIQAVFRRAGVEFGEDGVKLRKGGK